MCWSYRLWMRCWEVCFKEHTFSVEIKTVCYQITIKLTCFISNLMCICRWTKATAGCSGIFFSNCSPTEQQDLCHILHLSAEDAYAMVSHWSWHISWSILRLEIFVSKLKSSQACPKQIWACLILWHSAYSELTKSTPERDEILMAEERSIIKFYKLQQRGAE